MAQPLSDVNCECVCLIRISLTTILCSSSSSSPPPLIQDAYLMCKSKTHPTSCHGSISRTCSSPPMWHNAPLSWTRMAPHHTWTEAKTMSVKTRGNHDNDDDDDDDAGGCSISRGKLVNHRSPIFGQIEIDHKNPCIKNPDNQDVNGKSSREVSSSKGEEKVMPFSGLDTRNQRAPLPFTLPYDYYQLLRIYMIINQE